MNSLLHSLKKLLLGSLVLPAIASAAIISTPLPNILTNGTTADATQVMADFNAIVNGVNSNAAPLATTPQLNIINTFTQPQIIPNATALNHAINAGQFQQNSIKYLTDTGAANAYVVTPAPAWGSYIAGSDLYVVIGGGHTNTAASTIDVSGLGAKTIQNEDGTATEANALQAARAYHLIYDGTQFQVIGKNNTAVTPTFNDNSTRIATTAFVYLQVPAGTVVDFAGSSVPSGWLACDGSSQLRAGTFAALFAAIGTTWGSVDGTHFTVPDFRGRTTIDDGTGAGLSARTLGQTGGEENHLLSTAEMPVHNHTDSGHSHVENMANGASQGFVTATYAINAGAGPTQTLTVGSTTGANGATTLTTQSASAVIGNAGSGGTHNNMQPYAVVKKIIKY